MEVHHHPHVEKKKFKEYFLEFIMMFLAVSLGFLAENLRENITNHEKEKHYVNSILKDLQKDTADISLSVRNQDWLIKKMNKVLQLSVEELQDISLQDTLYQNLVPFYAGFWIFVQTNNTLTQLKSAGGFGVFTNQDVVDSISDVYYYYDAWIKVNSDFYMKWYEKTADLATQLIRLPETNIPFDDSQKQEIPVHGKVLIQYNTILLEQLYSDIRYQKGQLIACIDVEKEYEQKAARLINFLQKEYHLK